MHIRIPILSLACFASVPFSSADSVEYVQPQEGTGGSRAAVVRGADLVHTAQIFPVGQDGRVRATTMEGQLAVSMERLRACLESAGSGPAGLVKLNFHGTSEDFASDVEGILESFLPAGVRPASSFVQTDLPVAGSVIAVDAVAVRTSAKRGESPRSGFLGPSPYAVLPAGPSVYIGGQAESGPLPEATRATLESLERTLEFLGLGLVDVVQVKSFLQPMSEAKEVAEIVESFFEGHPVPPMVFVEWRSSPDRPIEIELVARGGPTDSSAVVEYPTPPGMTASPVFSRVARANGDTTIYVSGLNARSGDRESDRIRNIFGDLSGILSEAGSDLRHLVKATYYVSNEEASRELNAIRPEFYDPARPPAASKALVAGAGRRGSSVTIDTIAVPADPRDSTPRE